MQIYFKIILLDIFPHDTHSFNSTPNNNKLHSNTIGNTTSENKNKFRINFNWKLNDIGYGLWINTKI